MRKKVKKITFPKMRIQYVFILLTVFFLGISIIVLNKSYSQDTIGTVWDGISISKKFEYGNGSVENPYLITSAEDFAYFISVINSEEYNNYKNKIFSLNKDLNLGNHQVKMIGSTEKPFEGTFLGNGHTIQNLEIVSEIPGEKALFGKLRNAKLENININSVTINTVFEENVIDDEEMKEDISKQEANSDLKISLLATEIDASQIENLSIYNSTMDLSRASSKDIKISGISHSITGSSLKNIVVSIDVNQESQANFYIISSVIDSTTKLNQIIYRNENNNQISSTSLEKLQMDEIFSYQIIDNTIVFLNNKNQEQLIETLNESISNDYIWYVDGLNFKLGIVEESTSNILPIIDSELSLHQTGIEKDTIYINDLEADWNYYMGLNYTESATGTLPTGVNQNIYNENNLVSVQMTYHGTDIKGINTGYISLTERQSNYIYYKMYPISTNNTTDLTDDYVEIELIDNPYGDRPQNMAFHNWITNYPNAKVYLENDYYIRKVRIPITYDNNKPNNIKIDMYASWLYAKTGNITANNWSSVFNSFDSYGIHRLVTTDFEVEVPYKMTGYFKQITVSYGDSRVGYYSESGQKYTNGTCNSWWGGCTYYMDVSDEYYVEGEPYYKLENGRMSEINPNTLNFETEIVENVIRKGSMAGFYQEITVGYNSSQAGYYSSNGERLTGNCTTRGGCSLYEVIPYYDASGNENVFDSSKTYYYLATRDTNIAVMQADTNTTWSTTQSKPFTLTSLNNGIDFRSSATWTVSGISPKCYNDTRIEFIKIYAAVNGSNGDPTNSASATRYIYGNYHNLKIGRGIAKEGNAVNFTGIIGANNQTGNVGSRTNLTRYQLIVESGYYSTITLANARISRTTMSIYMHARGTYGSDYDRAKNENNNLTVYFDANGSWGGVYYSDTDAGIVIDTTVKSGSYGTSRSDHTTGIYVGGRSYGRYNAARRLKFEGGWVYNIIGGPLTSTDRGNYNDTYIHMTGGTAEMIIGGAGTSETYGNRLVQVTGGTVNYSVFGGSNGYNGSGSDGKLTGSSFVYIGGNAVIGNEEFVNKSNLFGAESGSVFGIGNGKSGTSTIGSNDNSNIMIDGNAKILNNVYGGGNYGATGVSSNKSTTKTNITILNGEVLGSVYGGGNQNGSGSETTESTIDIKMYGGKVQNIYGGSNKKGTLYGNANISIFGGTITKDIYGGGQGGYQSTTEPGTFVSGNISIIVGNSTIKEEPVIEGSVYGGSAYGTVNGTSNTTVLSESKTEVVVNKGLIKNSVFGGGKGSETYTPYVKGNIDVTINGGNINNVFGGNDAAGVPNGEVVVKINGGYVGNTFGGGNNASVKESQVYITGGESTYVYGGSNENGTVTTTNILTTGGTIGSLFGGNNIGGNTITTNVKVNGGTINSEVYGGGNKVAAETTNLILIKSDGVIPNGYGGGKEADATITNVTNQGVSIINLFGGSNRKGVVSTSNINIEKGNITNLYGGNNAGGTTENMTMTILNGEIENTFGGGNNAASKTAEIHVENGKLGNVFGGGNQAGIDTTTIDIHGGTIKNVYGGSNKSGDVLTTTITSDYKEPVDLSTIAVENIYGGNNEGGITENPKIEIKNGRIGNIFGGGNQAKVVKTDILIQDGTIDTVYGGGNQAGVSSNTQVIINKGTINKNLYGGGNYGTVSGNTKVSIKDLTILGSAYAGGNGTTAIVEGNTYIQVEGNTVVGTPGCKAPAYGSVFGGGNAAATGLESLNNSTATVNITSATIYGNVYGGANTSIIYGKTYTLIGKEVVQEKSMTAGNIYIGGTIFGGGEANADGSEIYDWGFVNVKDGIEVKINGLGHEDITIGGSIFGSGNAAITAGVSTIDIYNYGGETNIKKNISIQRANLLTINNSFFELSGAPDRSNDYSDELFSISRVDELRLENNSALYLQKGGKLVQKFVSLVDEDPNNLQVVDINDETKTVTKNANNRLYLLEGSNLNIATDASVTSFGEVKGMTFMGLYTVVRDGVARTGFYNTNYGYGEYLPAADCYLFSKGGYVLGLHAQLHDITKDGFYSHFEENEVNKVAYIDPTPKDSNYYRWLIGEVITEYNIELTASKYSTLGTVELPLLGFAEGNTTFTVLGFNADELEDGIVLQRKSTIPRVASTPEIADTVMGLMMETSNTGWMNQANTEYATIGSSSIYGNTSYISENSTTVPSLLFYLYHSKNLQSTGKMGKVSISLMATKKITDHKSENTRLIINITLSRALYSSNDYEGAMTPGRKYELFAPEVTNISSKSSVSAYFSLFAETENDIYKEGYHRALVSNYILPLNTQITMLDLSGENIKYYYHVVDEEDIIRATEEYQKYRECSYNLSRFITMGSTQKDTNYLDSTKNKEYYDSEKQIASEEFIFIVDFKNADINENCYNNSLLLELRNDEDQTIINVLGIEQQQLQYSIYTNQDALLELDSKIDPITIYKGESAFLLVKTNLIQNNAGSNKIYDTNYFNHKLGLKLTILDKDGNIVTGTTLIGVYFELNGQKYSPNIDGITRIKVSDRVANVESNIKIHTENANIATGNYRVKIESFSSPDGIYYGLSPSDTEEIPFIYINKVFGLKVDLEKEETVYDAATGTSSLGNNNLTMNINYSSRLENPNIRIKLYRRNYDEIYQTTYTTVDLQEYIAEILTTTNNEFEYLLLENPGSENILKYHLNNTLVTGTYKLEFSLYDNDIHIGNVERYIIIE